ncbi:MAG: DNA mismatch repair protein [Halobacteriota archaeon]
MRLQEFWGVGPKTAARLRESIGEAEAIEAIETGAVRTLTDAGIPRGRAVRILRRANDAAGMNVLGTTDTRHVYDDLLSRASDYALTEHAADRIRVLTPLTDRDRAKTRLDRILEAKQAWIGLTEEDKTTVIDAFAAYDDAEGSERAAVEVALAIRTIGLRGDVVSVLEAVETETLEAAADALGDLEETADGVVVRAGADAELDRLRGRYEAAAAIEDDAFDVIETVRSAGASDLESFKSGVVEYVAEETGIERGTVRSAAAADPVDAADFVSTTLRELTDDLRSKLADRRETVIERLRGDISTAGSDLDAVVDAVSDVAFELSLGRFAADYDLTRPEFVEDGVAVVDARNLFLDGDVQPITYGIGTHEITVKDDRTPPSGDRVSVLTGANSGGKTTLLETLCQVSLLATMGMPVPADRAEVGAFETIVFHRRHASFNAGVLESTLKSIVPPLADDRRTLMLVDEFEAITEPGRAADLLNGLVELTVDRNALGVYVTHLADDLSPLPEPARIDGIFAEGLTQDLQLRVDYQPRFGTIGKSTPEFIVSRLVANARDRAERAGFEALAAAVGQEAVQRTLSDVRWERT